MAQAASFFSAGSDTSATAIAFALYELAVNPEMQNKLREEILNALDQSNGKITYDMVCKCHNLFYVNSINKFILSDAKILQILH